MIDARGEKMDFGRTRYEQRKKKRVNTSLNIAIGIVVLFIVYFSFQLFFGGNPPEEAAADKDVTQEEPKGETVEKDKEPNVDYAKNERDEIEEDKAETESEEPIEDEPVVDGEWKPIGTSQSEPFVADYTKDSVNWQEMEKALRYAIGTEEKIVIWWLGNGGSPQSAEGVVSDPGNADTPYRVKLEWVTEKGWKPVSVEQLDHNPYR